MIPLALVSDGERVKIVDFIGKGNSLFCRLRGIGFVVDKVVEVVSNQGHGPILIKIDESRVAIGRGIAMKIMVRRLQ